MRYCTLNVGEQRRGQKRGEVIHVAAVTTQSWISFIRNISTGNEVYAKVCIPTCFTPYDTSVFKLQALMEIV